jgi:hypothetical protein
MVWVPILPLLGFSYGHWTLAADLRNPKGMVVVAVAWVLVHASAMYQNAALDRDQGEVLFGAPLPVPDHLETLGRLLGVAAVVVASFAGMFPALCALGCALLAVAYSHPRLAWKGHPLGGPAVNILGYGVLSPAAGWSLVGARFDLRAAIGISVLAVLAGSSWLVAQAFQEEEDRRRGYRTFVVDYGQRKTLEIARIALDLGYGVATWLAIIGWYPRPCLLGLVGFAWTHREISAWIADGDGNERRARRVLSGIVGTGLLFVLGALLEYLREDYTGQALCGLGTTYPVGGL